MRNCHSLCFCLDICSTTLLHLCVEIGLVTPVVLGGRRYNYSSPNPIFSDNVGKCSLPHHLLCVRMVHDTAIWVCGAKYWEGANPVLPKSQYPCVYLVPRQSHCHFTLVHDTARWVVMYGGGTVELSSL